MSSGCLIHPSVYWEVQNQSIPFIKRRESICISCCQRFSIIITIKCKQSSRETLHVKQVGTFGKTFTHTPSPMPWKCSHLQQAHLKCCTSKQLMHELKLAKPEFYPHQTSSLPRRSRRKIQGNAFYNINPYQCMDNLVFHCRQHANKFLRLCWDHVWTQVSISCYWPARQFYNCFQ